MALNGDASLAEFLTENGYTDLKPMPDGKMAGLHRMMYTTGLCVGMDRGGLARRYCYEREEDARAALVAWDFNGDPPGPWIKEKPSDRLGPGATG